MASFHSPWQLVVRSPHCVRDDNPELARESCHCEAWKAEAISLQTTFVFGLLRYARNDKSQDGREAQGLSPWQPYTCHKFFVIAMEWNDRSNLLASRSPHYVRDDNLFLHLLAVLVIAMERSDRSNLIAIPGTSSVNILLQNFLITIHLLKRLYK